MANAYALFGIIFITLILFIWGRWRYDVVSLFALLLCVLLGIVPYDQAFTGFSNAAVITVAAIMIISATIINSGLVDYLVDKLKLVTQYPTLHITTLTLMAALLSAFMNNIGALAILLPVAIKTSLDNQRSPSLVLMPMAFGSILGGMTTLIGTPPNILISSYRADLLGSQYKMFDFSPVGVGVAVIGCLFISLIGWRFLPARRKVPKYAEDMFQMNDYVTEVIVPEKSSSVGKSISELEQLTEGDFMILGLIRQNKKRIAVSPFELLQADDILIIEASHQDLKKLLKDGGLELVESQKSSMPDILAADDFKLIEAVVPPGSRLEGRSSKSMRLRYRYRLNVIAISREGNPFKQRLRSVNFKAGDVVLLQGDATSIQESAVSLGFLPLAERDIQVGMPQKAFLTFSLFALAIVATATGKLPVQISFALAALSYVVLNLIPIRKVYEAIEWPIIILLGAMIPIGSALETTGATTLISTTFIEHANTLPPYLILGLLLVCTMALTDLMNNAATAVVMAPIAASIAHLLNMNVDTFLMTVAVGASCSFLTPIGHQNNTLVLGPGGYSFLDYPRLGLPLDLLVIFIGIPLIMTVWPVTPLG